jgi:DNA-binding protein WhiA
MSFSSKVKEELTNKPPKSRHCKLAMLAGLSGEYKTADLSKECCRRAFIKGAFLAGGSVSDPDKSYHFEIAVPTKEHAEFLAGVIKKCGPNAKIGKRKDNYIVYIKDGEGIAELLNVMEAHVALMDIENVRILKDVRNSVNRQVNCDIANTRKTVGAAHRQIECIEYIKEHAAPDFLSPELAEMAAVRLENPEASLYELGQMLSIPLGKSGVNHRLAKLCEIAGDLRGRIEPSPETQGGMK